MTPEAEGDGAKSAREFRVDNELRKAGNFVWTDLGVVDGRRVSRVGRSGGHKKYSQWDDKSNFRSGCTEPWPIVAFYMQSRVKLWRGKGGDGGDGFCDPGRTIVLLADRKHHCITTAVRAVAAI